MHTLHHAPQVHVTDYSDRQRHSQEKKLCDEAAGCHGVLLGVARQHLYIECSKRVHAQVVCEYALTAVTGSMKLYVVERVQALDLSNG